MKKAKRKHGFIFISVLALMILVTSVVMSTAVINMTYAGEVSENREKEKSDYLSKAALEMTYGALSNVESGNSILSLIKKDIDSAEAIGKEYKIDDSKFVLKTQILPIIVNGKEIGYAHISGNLYKHVYKDESNHIKREYYYKILSKAGTKKEEIEAKKRSIFTMLVFIDNPSDPKIFSGDKMLSE